jgi:hypothetical protein
MPAACDLVREQFGPAWRALALSLPCALPMAPPCAGKRTTATATGSAVLFAFAQLSRFVVSDAAGTEREHQGSGAALHQQIMKCKRQGVTAMTAATANNSRSGSCWLFWRVRGRFTVLSDCQSQEKKRRRRRASGYASSTWLPSPCGF